jgi:hypothetical protein
VSVRSRRATARTVGLAIALLGAAAACDRCQGCAPAQRAAPAAPSNVAPPLQLSAAGRPALSLRVTRVRRDPRPGGVVLDLAARGGPNGWATGVVLHVVLSDDGAGHRGVQLEGSRCELRWLPGGVETAVDYGIIAGEATPHAGGTSYLELSLRCAKRRRVGQGGAAVAPGLPDEVAVAVSVAE